jgi:hypothetical protein
MNAEQIRSIGCGPVGALASAFVAGLIFKWQIKKWSRWIPTKVGQKGREQLLHEHKATIRTSKFLTLGGFCVILLLYKRQWFSEHDLRGLGLALGLMGISPIACIVIGNRTHGSEAIKEGLVAFAISESTPTRVLFAFMALCITVGAVSLVSLLLRP